MLNNKVPSIIFFGNTKYSVIGLQILHKAFGISCVVTIKNSPVETYAVIHTIPYITTQKLDQELVEKIKKLEPDFIVVEDYGFIIPKEILKIPKYPALNIHHSLLPKYRGPSPAPAAILAGEKITGVTIIEVAEKVDAGNIFAQKEYEVTGLETTDSLLQLLNQEGGKLIIEVIQKLIKTPTWKGIPQNIKLATWTKKLRKEDGKIDLSTPLNKIELDRMIRAFYPWPGVYFTASLANKQKIIKLLPDNMYQVEGKRPMSAKDFLNGYGTDAVIILATLGK